MSDLCGARLCLADAQGHIIYNSRSTAIIPYIPPIIKPFPPNDAAGTQKLLQFDLRCAIIVLISFFEKIFPKEVQSYD